MEPSFLGNPVIFANVQKFESLFKKTCHFLLICPIQCLVHITIFENIESVFKVT